MQVSSIHAGARLRLIAEEQTTFGTFARYTDLVALEYQPPQSDGAPLRIYRYRSGGVPGYYDGRGRQPFHSAWRAPVPFARISSRFNLRRMHPVLHVVRPHTGVDFAAATGTPVYAASDGRVLFVGDGGPSGHLVTLQHANSITTGYSHLSRFAPHLRPGQVIEVRQLIGYVGSTGRSTGPHLHFTARKNGVFIDPLTLRLDGERVLPKRERPDFELQRAQLDRKLDAIALPAIPDGLRSRSADEPTESQDLEPLEDEHP